MDLIVFLQRGHADLYLLHFLIQEKQKLCRQQLSNPFTLILEMQIAQVGISFLVLSKAKMKEFLGKIYAIKLIKKIFITR